MHLSIAPFGILASIPGVPGRAVGRAIRNLFEALLAGQLWAWAIVGVIGLIVVAIVAVQLINIAGQGESDDVEMTAEEKKMINRF